MRESAEPALTFDFGVVLFKMFVQCIYQVYSQVLIFPVFIHLYWKLQW